MEINQIFLLISFINAFRLLTLDSVAEKHNDIFIMNAEMKLSLQKITPSTIKKFYVVLHNRKLFFYNKGNYYQFVRDSDTLKIKLAPINLGKVQFFTQDVQPIRRVKVMKWDELIKKDEKSSDGTSNAPTKATSHPNQGRISNTLLEATEFKPVNVKAGNFYQADLEMDHNGTNQSLHAEYRESIPTKPRKNSMAYQENEESLPRPKSIPPESVVYEDNPRMIKPSKIRPAVQYPPAEVYQDVQEDKKSYRIKKSLVDEIESDSEMTDSKGLDLKVSTLNSNKKTFLLRNENNLCLTYFEKTFILAECTKNKRQIFRLVPAEDIAKQFKEDEKKKIEARFEDLNEISEETEDENKDIDEIDSEEGSGKMSEEGEEEPKKQEKKKKETSKKKKEEQNKNEDAEEKTREKGSRNDRNKEGEKGSRNDKDKEREKRTSKAKRKKSDRRDDYEEEEEKRGLNKRKRDERSEEEENKEEEKKTVTKRKRVEKKEEYEDGNVYEKKEQQKKQKEISSIGTLQRRPALPQMQNVRMAPSEAQMNRCRQAFNRNGFFPPECQRMQMQMNSLQYTMPRAPIQPKERMKPIEPPKKHGMTMIERLEEALHTY